MKLRLLGILILFLAVLSTISHSQNPTVIITERTEYGLTTNTVYITIEENLGKDQNINISNIFTDSSLTREINYDSVLLKQDYIADVYGYSSESQGKVSTESCDSINTTDCYYYDDKGMELFCDSVLADKSCMRKVYGIIGQELKSDYLPIPNLKEKVVVSGNKIEQKHEGIPLPKNSVIYLKYVYFHPKAFQLTVPNEKNKYDIKVSSAEGYTVLDPTWFNSSWGARRNATFTNMGWSSTNLDDFVVLLVLNSTNIDYAKTQNNGADLRILDADDSTELDFEIVKWNESGNSYVWARVPNVANTTTDFIWYYYDNAGASDGQDMTGTWVNYNAVYHLDRIDIIGDSTANGYDGDDNSTAPILEDGKVHYGLHFDGSSDYINFPSGSFPPSGDWTFMGWVKLDSYKYQAIMVDYPPNNVWMYFTMSNTDNQEFYLQHGNSGTQSTTDANVDLDTWYFVTWTYDGANSNFYVNETLKKSFITTTRSDIDGWALGVRAYYNDLFWDGYFDEIRILSSNISSDVVKATYQSEINNFITYGAEESAPAPDDYPTWCCNGTITQPPFYVNVFVYPHVNLSDDINLSGFIWSWNYSGSWHNGSFYDLTGNLTWNITDQALSVGDSQNVSWQVFFNDSNNQWNQTDIWTFEVLPDANPGWYHMEQTVEFYEGAEWHGSVNATDDINLSWWVYEEQLPNGSWYNFSNSSTWTECITPNTDCQINVSGYPSPAGNHSWRMWFNDSVNHWNSTDTMVFVVLPDPYPSWDSNITNATTPIVPPVTVYWWAMLYDTVFNLSHYMCSWSATGVWENSTPSYIGNQSFNASCTGNLTIPGGDVGYAIWFNDTLNQWNRTDTFVFEIPYADTLANITDWTITPCLATEFETVSWQVGENFTLYVDVDGDVSHYVQARITLDYGEVNETMDSGWYGYYNTSPPYQFTFSFNITNATESGTIVIMARDIFNMTAVNVTETFSVTATGGMLEGECWTSMGDVITPVEPAEEENILIKSFKSLASSGNVSLYIFWLLMMALISIVIWFYLHHEPLLAGGGVLAANLMMAFVGVAIGIFSAGMFTLLVIFIIVAGILMFRKKVMG